VTPIDWLLDSDSDPAIRWQAVRDLTDADPSTVAAERARVTREGLGAAILSHQQADGAWRREGAPAWLTTLFTLQLLRATGADPADSAIANAMALAESTLRWDCTPGNWDLRSVKTGNPFFEGEEEPCINGGVLAFGAYFGHLNEKLARRLLSEQLPDGGWNCDAPKSKCSSFHTTICVLEGLLEYERAIGVSVEIAAARRRAEEYLLERALFRRKSTGEVACAEFLEFAFPPRYRYDILRALDYFRAAGARSDPRMSEAIAIIESKRQPDGRWLLENSYTESLALPLAESIGQPSRWNTLRALRVLSWYRKK
jgi:Prenyltransferase and squalene oxidase repeat